MNNSKELYIDSGINSYIDIVFARTYFFETNPELKNIILGGKIKIDYNNTIEREYSPFYDCLYYPTVSKVKCANQYDKNDWQKLQQEIESRIDTELPTYEIYYTNRLNNELSYFLKSVFQATLYPQEFPNNIGFEYFINQYHFIYKNFPDKKRNQEYKQLWIKVLENLKNDNTVVKMDFSGNKIPLGNFVVNQLNWLIEKIKFEQIHPIK